MSSRLVHRQKALRMRPGRSLRRIRALGRQSRRFSDFGDSRPAGLTRLWDRRTRLWDRLWDRLGTT